MRRLVVAEKFSAALRLATVLSEGMVKRLRADGVSQFTFSRAGDEWRVFPLRGHLVNTDYPQALNDWDRTELTDLIDAEPVPVPTDPGRLDALRLASDSIDELVIATDYDREGELIGLEAVHAIREVHPAIPVRRVRFSALTRRELLAAFDHLAELDENLASSAAAREVVDLAWGAVLTRFLSLACDRRGREVLSVGRVQTPALAIVTAREKEIEEFVPTPWWRVRATLGLEERFSAEHANGPFWHRDEAEASAGLAGLATDATVLSIDAEERQDRAPVPLNTTLFLGLASRAGFSAARAMTIAESLYRAGLISYPRTDNTVYPPTLPLRAVVEDLSESDLAEEARQVLALPAIRPTRGRTKTTDHPPIYPTGAARRAALKVDQWRVYEIVVRRFLATLMPPARDVWTTVRLDVAGVPFLAAGAKEIDPGWRTVLHTARERSELPRFEAPSKVPLTGVVIDEGATRPPARFTQGSLIQEMETVGIGTKSTRHEIVQKLYDRGYVSGRSVRPTDGGRAVAEALQVFAPSVTKAETTRELEDRLEAIAEGRVSAHEVIAEGRTRLREALGDLEAHRESLARWIRDSLEWERDQGPCEKCEIGRMVVRKTRRGARFLGCTNYPACHNSRAVAREPFVLRARPSEATLAG